MAVPAARIIALTKEVIHRTLVLLLAVGADTVLPSDTEPGLLRQAVLSAHPGGRGWSPELKEELKTIMSGLEADDQPAPATSAEGTQATLAGAISTSGDIRKSIPFVEKAGLTDRECDVLVCLLMGYSNTQIATRLGIKTRTVRFHVANILSKVHAGSRAAAAWTVIKHALTDPLISPRTRRPKM